jgi:AcrR family transcriptional regulator
MARKTKRRQPARTASAASAGSTRDKIIEALMTLLADHAIEDIGLADIASEADVTLSELRAEFGSPMAMLAAYIKDIDRKVLDGGDDDMDDESPRERLFDVLMRRLELLEPHKAAIRSLIRSATRNPGLALTLNAHSVCSQQWMLTAAGIGASGPKGMIRAQGLALMFANVIRTWVNDHDEGHAHTLAALDRELARGQRLVGLLDELCKIPERARQFTRGGRRSRRDRDEHTTA